MLKNLAFVILTVSLFTSCAAQQNAKEFGAKITPDNAISYDNLITKMNGTDSLAVKITGKVSTVCLKKGCWMTLVPDQPGQPEMRVTFKDYGFFMPKDIVGKKVVLDGFAYVDVTPVEVLRHYAEDAGKTKAEIEAITEPKRELAYEANGVIILE